MKNSLLPIGSIVRVSSMDLMICAYFKKDAIINNKRFDYACCLYPTGLDEKAILISKDQIEKILFIGFQDSRFTELKEKMEN